MCLKKRFIAIKNIQKLSARFGWSHAYSQYILDKYRRIGNYKEAVMAMEADYKQYNVD